MAFSTLNEKIKVSSMPDRSDSSRHAFFPTTQVPSLKNLITTTFGLSKILELAKVENENEIKALYQDHVVEYTCEQMLGAQLNEVKAMLDIEPKILFDKCKEVQDKAGRTYKNMSPFQCLLAVEDFYHDMLDMIKFQIDRIENGREIAKEQLSEQLPEQKILSKLTASTLLSHGFKPSTDSKRFTSPTRFYRFIEKPELEQKTEESTIARSALLPVVVAILKENFEGNSPQFLVKFTGSQNEKLLPNELFKMVKHSGYLRVGEKLMYIDKEKASCLDLKLHFLELYDFDNALKPNTTPRALAKADFEEIFKITGHMLLNKYTENVLENFRKELNKKNIIQQGKTFNAQYLICAYKLYAEFEENFNMLQSYLYLVQVIGGIQRVLPTNLAAAFCQGLLDGASTPDNILVNISKLDRTLTLSNHRQDSSWLPNLRYNFYPIDYAPNYRLGFDFFIVSHCQPRGYHCSLYFNSDDDAPVATEEAALTLEKLCEMKEGAFKQFKDWLNIPKWHYSNELKINCRV